MEPDWVLLLPYLGPALVLVVLASTAWVWQRRVARRLARTSALLRAMIDNIPDLAWLKDASGRFIAVNGAMARAVKKASAEAVVGRTTQELYAKQVADGYLAQDNAVMKSRERLLVEEEHPDGDALRWFETCKSPIVDGDGRVIGTAGIAHDITARRLAEQLVLGQRDVLELIARDAPLAEVLRKLVLVLEAQAPGALCTVGQLDVDRRRLVDWVAPSVPPAFIATAEGLLIGPGAGSCGTAAFLREPVVTVDIAQDPLWAEAGKIALQHGLRACWSTPIFDSKHEVIGTFAIYYRSRGSPDERARRLIDVAVHVAAIAIERKRTDAELAGGKAALERSVSLLNATIEATSEGVFVFDRTGKATKYNKRFVKMWQIPADLLARGEAPELRKWFCAQVSDPARFAATASEILAHPGRDHLTTFELKDGRTYESRARPQWVGRELAGIVLTCRDVTESARAELALRQSEERHRALVEGANVVVWEYDLVRGVYTYVSPRAEVLLGYSRKAWEDAKFWSAHLHPGDRDRVIALGREHVDGKRDHRIEYRMIRADGSTIWVEDVVSVQVDADRKAKSLRGVMIDITSRKEAEADAAHGVRERGRLESELRRRQRELERFSRLNLLSGMASGIAHELNQPLAAARYGLRGCIQRAEIDELSRDDAVKVLSSVYRQIERASGIVEHMANLSRRRRPATSTLSAAELLGEVVGLAAHESWERETAIALDIAAGLPTIHANRVQMEQVVWNLLRNAIEATRDAGEAGPVTLGARKLQGAVEVFVSDNGHGFTQESLQHLFEPFFTTKEDGMGLGLSICQMIVESWGGFIRAENNPGGGATVRFTIPVNHEEEAAA